MIMGTEKQKHQTGIQISREFKGIDFDTRRLEILIKTVFEQSGRPETRYEISIAVVNDAQIRKLNSQFLNEDNSTDCLSFDLSENDPNQKSFELVVNGEMAVKEAELRGHSGEAELALYITHALLHNLGFDDSTENQAKKMHGTEDNILQQLGYGLVYNS